MKDANHAAQDVGCVRERYPEVTQIWGDFEFRGQGQQKTPVADIRGAVELTFLLPGRHATQIRRQAAKLTKHLCGLYRLFPLLSLIKSRAHREVPPRISVIVD